MNKFKLSLWWIGKNHIQLITIFYLTFFCGQICRLIVQTLFNF